LLTFLAEVKFFVEVFENTDFYGVFPIVLEGMILATSMLDSFIIGKGPFSREKLVFFLFA
jgi:hypothetical protein